MRQYLLLLSVALNTSVCSGQEIITAGADSVLTDSVQIEDNFFLRKRYHQGDIELVHVYYADGRPYREYYVKNQAFDRHFKEWNTDGKLLILTPYVEGHIHGHWQEWNSAGACILDAHIRGGRGTITYYYDDGTRKRVDVVNRDGTFMKPPKCWQPDGKEVKCPTISPH